MLKSAKRQSVKVVILLDINLLAAKIESLKELVSVQAKSEMQWSDVVAGRKKTFSYTRQIKSHSIPVINNQFELTNNRHECGFETTSSMRVQQMIGKCKFKKDKKVKKRHKIIITRDSHARSSQSSETRIRYGISNKYSYKRY
jgi:hypothetical protein